jgi:adenylate cyclase
MANPNLPPTDPLGAASEAGEQRRLAVIMFTDMVGYSALTQRNEALALQLLEEHRQVVRPVLARHGGQEIKTIGDAFLVEFSSALAAVTCAIELQRSLHARNDAAPADRQVRIRIGLHAGDVIHRENDVFGDGVNIAARIEPLAEAGGICLSEDVARQIQNKIDCPLAPLGSGDLKNISLPVEIYRVILPWQKARSPQADRLAFQLRKKVVRRALGAVALAGLVVVALLVWRRFAPIPAGPVNRLAVLPLVNIGGDSRDEYFADGMTEELISSLSTIRDLNVIARTSIAKFKGAQHDIAEIGAALNVGSILEGSVRLAGEDARINVNLVEVRSQKTIWSEEFTRKIKDIFAIQSAIARSVTEALQVQLLSGERSLLDRRGTDNNDAYRQYLLGRSHLSRRTGDEVGKAIEYFSRAVEQDPSFALAYAGLAEGYTLAGNAGYGTLPRDQAIARARDTASKAVQLDDSLAEAHAALGYVRFRIDWDWAGAETEFKRALALKPGSAAAHERYGLYLAIRHRFAEAQTEMQRALQLDPLSASVGTGLGRVFHFERRFDEANVAFKKTLAIDPQYAEAYFGMGMSYQGLHKYDEAIGALKTAIALSGNRPVMVALLGMNEGLAGHRDEARRIYEDMVQQSRTAPVSSYAFGLISIGLGDVDRAFAYFEQALAERDGILIYLAVDPVAETVWSDPRYAALVRKMGLQP